MKKMEKGMFLSMTIVIKLLIILVGLLLHFIDLITLVFVIGKKDILKGSVPFFDFDEFEKIEEFGSYGIVFNWEHGEKAENWIYDDILEANEIGAKRKEREEWHDFLKRGYERTFTLKNTPFKGFRKNVKIVSKKDLYRLINSNGREVVVGKWRKFVYGSTRLERA